MFLELPPGYVEHILSLDEVVHRHVRHLLEVHVDGHLLAEEGWRL